MGLMRQIPDVALNQEDFYTVADMLSKAKGVTKKVDVYLETPGGSGEAAEEIVEFLRRDSSRSQRPPDQDARIQHLAAASAAPAITAGSGQ